MADRASVSKVSAKIAIGSAGVSKSPKVVAYLLLEPGADETDSERQGCVFSNIIARPD